MGLRDKALAQVRVNGSQCSVKTVRDAMPLNTLAEFDELLVDISVPATAISRALRDEGYDLGALPLQRHRSGACKCR